MKKHIVWLMMLVAFGIQAAPKSVLVFATEATYPPHVYLASSGAIQGFDVDIVQALCQQMHTTCRIINRPWESLIPGLKLGKFNAIFGGLAITSARAQVVDFTVPYYQESGSFIYLKNKTFNVSPEHLKGKVIGVQAGTTLDFYLQARYARVLKIKRYTSEQNAFLDLKSGRIDAVLGDTPVIKAQLTRIIQRTHSMDYQISPPIQDAEYLGQGDAIAVRKGNQPLLTQLNSALTAIKDQGVYQQIKARYFK